MSAESAIEVHNVSKAFKVYLDKGNTLKERVIFKKRRKYENRHVLNDVSFEIKKGEAVGLIGHNGCGKSTTLKLLTRIMYPDSGTIVMKGRVSSLIELGAGFHPDMSGRENIYINASIFGLTKKEIDERLEEIITFSELEDYIDNPVRTYSSGMYMRLAFAVAINVDADILLIDEILAVGDANFQTKCFERLFKLKASGVTIVIVTHDMNSTRRLCDRVIWINEGKVAAEGKAIPVVDEYLAYMTEERIERKKTEEAAEAVKKDSDDENDTDSESDDSEDKIGKRYGNRDVQIVSVDMINSKGEVTDVLQADEAFCLDYHYKVNRPTDEINVGMGIFTIEGDWIFGTNTMFSEIQVKCNRTEGRLKMECEPLRLFTGEYVLQVAIVGMDGTPYDYWQEYKIFHVENKRHEAGIIHYDVKWTV